MKEQGELKKAVLDRNTAGTNPPAGSTQATDASRTALGTGTRSVQVDLTAVPTRSPQR